MASRLPINRFINVDFPTFGRPRIPTIGNPSKFRSRNNSQTRSTVSSKFNSVESIKTASAAMASGDTFLVESMRSLSSKEFFTSTAEIPEISASLRSARASKSAVRYSFNGDSGATTLPISRPSTTIPRGAFFMYSR